jgi:hypothetical protein
VPGHHEGDLIMGSKASNSAVGTIVERMTGYLTLLHLPDGHGATAVAGAVIDRMSALPAWFTRTLTWDRGSVMARHQAITDATGIGVYFADPTPPGSAAATRTPTACSASTSQGHRPVRLDPRPAPGHRQRAQRPPPQGLRLPHAPRATHYSSPTTNALQPPPESAEGEVLISAPLFVISCRRIRQLDSVRGQEPSSEFHYRLVHLPAVFQNAGGPKEPDFPELKPT